MEPSAPDPAPVPPPRALLAQVRELEARLAEERERNGVGLRELDRLVQSLRASVRDLQERVRHNDEERAQLRARLGAAQEEVATLRLRAFGAEPPEGRDPAAREGELAAAREEVARLAQRIEELEARPAARDPDPALADRADRLEAELARRDQALLRSAERVADADRRAAAAEVRLARAQEQMAELREAVVAAKGAGPRPAPPAAGPATRPGGLSASDTQPLVLAPEVPGLRIERAVADTAHWALFEAREIRSRAPCVLLLLRRRLDELPGDAIDALLLARHANLLGAQSFGVCPAGPYVQLDRPDGETAEVWVARAGALPGPVALGIVLDAARGLRHGAFHGALHTDLSPAALHVDAAGRVRVEGAGLAALVRPAQREPRAPAYASPERLRGSPPPDVRSDVYSLGAVWYFLLTGRPPFDGDAREVARLHSVRGLPDLLPLRPDVGPDAAAVLRRMCALDPEGRPQTWDEALGELERLVPVAPVENRPWRRLRDYAVARPYATAAAAILPLALLGLAAAALVGGATPRERFDAAVVHAERLRRAGDAEGARRLYGAFAAGTGDLEVEREAALRLGELNR